MCEVTERSLALVCHSLFREPNALLRIGRFELLRTLGHGGSGVVYEARDPTRGDRVALKVLKARTPGNLYRLKREFRSLAEIVHPNLVSLHELSVEDSEPYFTMELVQGKDLVAYVRGGIARGEPPPDVAALKWALAQLAEGIFALHSAGKLHRDLKPSNVLVTEEDRVVLLDFGLVQDAEEGATDVEGTPAYMAPEQAHGAPCEASDWYSFGLILWTTLTGEPVPRPERVASPFEAPNDTAPLERLAAELTHVDAARRPGFGAIMKCLGETGFDSESRELPRARFVARSAELEQLSRAFARSRSGPCMAIVRGESGIGKSALLKEFARVVLDPKDALVFRGRCYERESLPFKGMDSVVDELSRHLLSISPEQAPTLSDEELEALLDVFPVLGRVAWLRRRRHFSSVPLPSELRALGFSALKSLLSWLGRTRPVVLIIEDIQWSDVDTGALLGALLCGDESPPLLVLASDRTEARTANPTIEELEAIATLSASNLDLVTLPLGPLDPAALSALARAALPREVGGATVERLVVESRGSPLWMQELLRWTARLPDPREPRVMPSLDALFEARFQNLSRTARHTLRLLSAAGRPVTLAVLARAAEASGERTAPIEELRALRLVRVVRRGATDSFELEHGHIGRSAVRGLSRAQLKALHAALARAFESGEGQDSEALVEQYIAAEMHPEAAQCARQAAAAALSGLAFGRAAWMYERALAWGTFSDGDRRALHRDHAVALEQCGHGIEAAAAYRRAAALEPDLLTRVQLEQRAAERLMHCGRYEDGEALLERVYGSLGLPWPKHRATLALSTLRYSLPRRIRSTRRASVEVRRARAKFLSDAGRAIQSYDLLRAVHNALICLDEGARLPDRIWNERARGARGMMRCFGMLLGGAERGLSEVEHACRVARELGDVAGQADLFRQLGVARYLCGKPRPALEAAEIAEGCLRQLKPPPIDLYAIMAIVGPALTDLGELREAHRRWNAFAHEARLHGDVTSALWLHGHPAQFVPLFAMEKPERADDVLHRQARLREMHPRYRPLAWMHALSNLERELYWGSPGDVQRAARRDAKALFASGYGIFTEAARLTRARARLTVATAEPLGLRRSHLLMGAAADAKFRGRRRSVMQNGIALLVEAGIAIARDRPDLALSRLADSGRNFEAAEAKLMMATVQYCRGMLLGGDDGRALKSRARDSLTAEGVLSPERWIGWAACGFRPALDRGQ